MNPGWSPDSATINHVTVWSHCLASPETSIHMPEIMIISQAMTRLKMKTQISMKYSTWL